MRARPLLLLLLLALLGLLASPETVDASRNSALGAARGRTATTKARTGHRVGKPAPARVSHQAQAALASRPTRPRVLVGPRGNPITKLPPGSPRRIVFGVMGGAGGRTPVRIQKASFTLGAEIADAGDVVLTGACPGLPDDAVRGARSRGGLAVGISPHRSLEAHLASDAPADFDVLQFTSLPAPLEGEDRPNFMGREIDNIVRSDAIIIVGGRTGTLGELAIAFEERRPIGVLTGSGGIADIVKQIVAASTRAGKPPGAPVIYDRDPKRLVRRLARATQEFRASGKRGPLGDGDEQPAR